MRGRETGRLLAQAVRRRYEQAVGDKGRAALVRVFRALAENGCEPEWTPDGRGIVARCPCCKGERSLLVSLHSKTEPTQ